MNTKVRVTSLDYNEIRNGLIEYLKNTPDFANHNFAGSNMSMLMDVLAYNTYNQALMSNMIANEMFIDTAAKRSSVVSHAKLLGYTPRSRRSATAKINLTLTITTLTPSESLVLPVGTTFVSSVDSQTFNFVTESTYTAIKVTTATPNRYSYTFSNVELKEGAYTTNTFEYLAIDPFIRIPNRNIDTTTLLVRVEDAETSTFETYSPASNFLNLDSDSKVYFVQESYDGYYQIYFGDGTLGYKPPDNSIVSVNYITTSGAPANGAGAANNGAYSFRLASSLVTTGESLTETVVVLAAASGGREAEGTESVRFNAVNYYGTLNRAVVVDDYANLVSANIDNVKEVIAWGGENNTPPRYGSVMLCVIPEFGSFLTNDERENIRSFLLAKSVANTRIEFVDPEYIDIQIASTVIYDKQLMGITVYDLESAVRATISNYSDLNLQQFGGTFRFSELSRKIDSTYDAIKNNTISLQIKRDHSPSLFTDEDIKLNLANPLDSTKILPAITSTGFTISGNSNIMFVEDDRKGKLMLVYYVGTVKHVFEYEAGTVNYKTGELYLNPLNITSYIGEFITFNIQIEKMDVISKQNTILRIRDANITVKALPDYE